MLRHAGFVRVKEAAQLLGVSPNTVRSWGADGKITEFRHPANNYRLYKRKDIERLLRKVEQSATAAGVATKRRSKPR